MPFSRFDHLSLIEIGDGKFQEGRKDIHESLINTMYRGVLKRTGICLDRFNLKWVTPRITNGLAFALKYENLPSNYFVLCPLPEE